MDRSSSASPTLRWRVRVLGGVQADDGTQTIDRFGSAGVAALLARLAMFPGRKHAREELIELLWPGVGIDVGRNRLRQTLFSLRALLEPPSSLPRPVLIADRAAIAIVEGTLACDAVEFERAVREARFADALALYRGELMPGQYEDWIDEERLRLAALAERAERAQSALATEGASPMSPARIERPPALARRERAPLPLYLTRFFGRADELVVLRETIAAHRLVTLLGRGGAGKTRLAIEACGGLRSSGPNDGLTVFVALVGCATRDGLIDALALALRLAPDETDPLDRLIAALETRPALLVLDNFEQLVDVGADVVASLLASLPALHVLVTSRRALGLDGERQVAVNALEVPTSSSSLAVAAESPAVGLFLDRARAVRADFHLSERNRSVVLDLVAALDGLPLALELAASRVRSVSPSEMLVHLRPTSGAPSRAAFDLLARAGHRVGGDPRHASMLRTIEWSWNLLAAPLQRLLAELTVFDGGFTLEAAYAVASDRDTSVFVMLDELVGHSLLSVQRSEDAGSGLPTRYALDESIRAYAAATLDDAGSRELRSRYRRWLVGFGRAMPATPPLALLRVELRNVAAAVGSALADGAAADGVEAMVALRRVLPDLAVPGSLLVALESALESMRESMRESMHEATGDRALASRGWTLLGRLQFAAGAPGPARAHAERGLALARSAARDVDDGDALLARALQTLASIVWRTARDAVASEALLDECEPLAARAGDVATEASAFALRAFIANLAHRDLARAERLHGEALRRWEAAGDAISANNGRYNLAVCALRAGRHDEVLARLVEVAREAQRLHDWRLLSQAHNVAGESQAGRRDWGAAATAYRDSLELAWNALAQPSFAYALWNLPRALARLRRPEAAARLGGAAERVWTTRSGVLDSADRRDLRRLRRLVAAQVGAARTEQLWRDGAALSLPDVVELALADRASAPRPERVA